MPTTEYDHGRATTASHVAPVPNSSVVDGMIGDTREESEHCKTNERLDGVDIVIGQGSQGVRVTGWRGLFPNPTRAGSKVIGGLADSGLGKS